MNIKPLPMKNRSVRAKLIFNPGSGAAGESPVQLMDVIGEMRAWQFIPEAYMVEPGSELPEVVKDALEQGIRMFVVCGGDGTIDPVAGALAGTTAILGILPTGTQNNVALSLGIPEDIPLYALALLVGITRMYVGAHYPRDVLAGAILGSAWGLLGGIVDPYVLKGFG